MASTAHFVLETVIVLVTEREVYTRGRAACELTGETDAEAAFFTETVLWSITDERRTAEFTPGVGAFNTARAKFTQTTS